MVYITAQRFASLGGPLEMSAFEAVKVDFTKLTIAHAQLLVLRAFLVQVQALEQEGPPEVHRVFLCLFRCLALAWLDDHLAEFLIAKVLTLKSHAAVAEALAAACAEARQTAVPVVDAFRHTDNFLNSALGR